MMDEDFRKKVAEVYKSVIINLSEITEKMEEKDKALRSAIRKTEAQRLTWLGAPAAEAALWSAVNDEERALCRHYGEGWRADEESHVMELLAGLRGRFATVDSLIRATARHHGDAAPAVRLEYRAVPCTTRSGPEEKDK